MEQEAQKKLEEQEEKEKKGGTGGTEQIEGGARGTGFRRNKKDRYR